MRPTKSNGREYYKYAGLGFEFSALVGLFFYFGYLADQRWDSDPWGILIGGGIGFIGATYHLAKEGSKMADELDGSKNESSDQSKE